MYGDHVADNNAMAELNLLFVLLRSHSEKTNDDDDDDDDDGDDDDDYDDGDDDDDDDDDGDDDDDDDDYDDDDDDDDDRYMIRKHASGRTRRFVVSYEDHNLQDPALLTAAYNP
jgi:hypothetical protein